MKNHMIILRKLALHFFSFLILASCTTTKQLHQVKTNITTETSTHETTVSNYQVIANTKIVESKDTSLYLEGHELYGSGKVKNLLSGDTIFSTDASLTLKTWYDSLTKTIKTQATAKPREVSFKYNKITERQELQTGTTTSTKQEQQKQTVQTYKKEKTVSRSTLPIWLIIIIIITVLGVVLFFVLKFKRISPFK